MKKQIVKVNKQDIIIKGFNSQRVVTFKDIDIVHERPEGTARRNFNTNKSHLIEGEDYFVRNSSEAKTEYGVIAPNGLTLLTESGYLMLVKSFTDELAWKVQRQLVNSYFKTQEQEKAESKAQSERLASVNNAVKILTPLLEKAGCDSKIQLLTAKQLYEKAQVFLPIEIEADKRYWDTVHIARQAGICYKSSGKPADKAVNEIIRRIGVTEADYTDTWESKGKWQGTVRKYSDEVIERVRCWITDNDYPLDIEYRQSDGQVKSYHVAYKIQEVA